MENIEGIEAVRKAIRALTGDNNAKNVSQSCIVSAETGGKTIIESESIGCQFSIGHNDATINVFWEDYGYKGYKQLGLYGQMNTKWQIVKSTDGRVIPPKNNRSQK